MAARAASVTRALTSAGLKRSEFLRSGMVKGWGTVTEGFQSEQEMIRNNKRVRRGTYKDGRTRYAYVTDNKPTGRVIVHYHLNSDTHRNLPDKERQGRISKALSEAQKVLKERGYVIETMHMGLTGVIIVTKPEEES